MPTGTARSIEMTFVSTDSFNQKAFKRWVETRSATRTVCQIRAQPSRQDFIPCAVMAYRLIDGKYGPGKRFTARDVLQSPTLPSLRKSTRSLFV
jgi:hypothetical protein